MSTTKLGKTQGNLKVKGASKKCAKAKPKPVTKPPSNRFHPGAKLFPSLSAAQRRLAKLKAIRAGVSPAYSPAWLKAETLVIEQQRIVNAIASNKIKILPEVEDN